MSCMQCSQLNEGSSGAPAPSMMGEVKKVMNLVYHTLQSQFVPEVSYDGLEVRQTLLATIRVSIRC